MKDYKIAKRVLEHIAFRTSTNDLTDRKEYLS